MNIKLCWGTPDVLMAGVEKLLLATLTLLISRPVKIYRKYT